MKSIMSFDTYKKLKFNELNTASIPHVVGASGESLGTRGRTRSEVHIDWVQRHQVSILKACNSLT